MNPVIMYSEGKRTLFWNSRGTIEYEKKRNIFECIILLSKGPKKTPEDEAHCNKRFKCNEIPNRIFPAMF